MNNKLLGLILTALFVFCFNSPSLAQTEYFVSIDQQTGNYTKINKLPGVNWINPYDMTYDQASHHYFYCGSSDKKNWRFYTVDGYSGSIIDSPVFYHFTDTLDNINGLAYNEADNIIYGLHWSDSAKKEYFISVDPVTGTYTVIKEIPGVMFINPQPVIDPINKFYLFIGVDKVLGGRYYTIDLNTGNIIYSTSATTTTINQMKYDNQLRKIYGLHINNSSFLEFGSFDASTGNFDKISTISGIKLIASSGNYYSYDAEHHSYIFVGLDSNKNNFLISIDAITGEVVNKTAYHYVSMNSDNVICFQYDNALNKLFALHWESQTPLAPEISVYPNPFSSQTNIVFRNTYAKIEVLVYCEEGKLVSKQSFTNSNEIVLNRYNLASAIYYANVYADNTFMGTIKLFAQ